MEENKSSIFEFGLDEQSKQLLISIAKWQKFLAIVSIVCCSLGILGVIFGGSFLFTTFSRLGRNSYEYNEPLVAQSSAVFGMMIVIYVIMFLVVLIPNIFRLNFAIKTVKAIQTQDQVLLNEGFAKYKTYSVYWGVLTIIGLAFYALIIVIALVGVLATR